MASGQSTEPLEGNSKYAKVSDLGRGSYGIVQLATDKTTGEEVFSSLTTSWCYMLNAKALLMRYLRRLTYKS